MSAPKLRAELINLELTAATPSAPTPAALEAAENEFEDKRKKLKLWCSLQDLEDACNEKGDEGRQVTAYFNFVHYVLVTNFVMCIWYVRPPRLRRSPHGAC